jgi:hypothetical protein
MGNAPKSFAHGGLLAMTPARIQATAAAVAVAAAWAERNNIRGFVAFRAPFPSSSSSSKRQTKAKLSLITHHTQTSSSSHLTSHLI